MPIPLHVLIIEDRSDDAELMVNTLRQNGFEPTWRRVESEPDYLAALGTPPDLILADWSLPQFSGPRALELMKDRHLDIPFIIVSSSIGKETAVEAIRQGAYDYVPKDSLAHLSQVVMHALEDKRLRDEQKQASMITGLRSVMEMADELIVVRDVDALYRRAVELGREKLGLERCALFIDKDGEIYGTYGTDHLGRTTDEHGQHWNKSADWMEHFALPAAQAPRWIVVEEPHLEWNGERSVPVGQGWVAITPIWSSQQPIGVFVNDTAISHAPLDPIRQENLSVFCSLIGNIAERKRAEQELRLKVEQLTAINQASVAVTASLDLDRVLGEIVSLAGKVAGSDYTSIVLVDKVGKLIEGIDDVPDVLPLEQRARKRGFTSWIIRTRQPAIADTIDGEGAIKPRVGKGAPTKANPHLVAKGIRSFAGLPMIVGERVAGVLYLHSLHPGAFHGQETLLTTFANQAAMAIEKARLYDETQNELAERKQAERELLLLSQAIKSVSESVSITDLNDKILFVNDAALKTYGYEREELIGQNIAIVRSDKNAPGTLKQINPTTQKGHWEGELINKRKDGREFPIHLSTSPVRDGDGHIIGLIGVAQDITEQKQAQAELQASEERFAKSFQSNPIATVLSLLPEGQMVDVNEAFLRLTGYSREEALGKTGLELGLWANPEDRARLREALLGHRQIREAEGQLVTKMGERRDVLASVELVEIAGQPHILIMLMDVTERKRAVEGLRKSEEQYRLLFENMAEGVFYQQADEFFTDVNQSALDMIGLTREEFIGKTSDDPHWNVINEEGLALSGDQHPSMVALRTGEMVRDRTIGVYNPQKRAYTWMRVNAIPQFKFGSGEPYQVIVTLHDITAYRQAQEALANTKAMLEAAFDQTPIPMVMVSAPEGIVQLANPASLEFLGVQDEPVPLGQSLLEISPSWQDFDAQGNPLPLAEMPLAKALQGIETRNTEYFARRKDGTIRWELVSTSPVRNGAGKMIAAYLAFPDITERKLAAEALRAAEEKYRLLVEQIPVVTYEAEVKGGCLYVSPQIERFSGFPASEWLSDPEKWEQRLHPDDRQRVVNANDLAQKENTGFTCEYRLIRKDGKIIWIHDEGQPASRTSDGRQVVRGIWQDITERRQAEQALRESEDRYRRLVELSPDAIFIERNDGCIDFINQAGLRLFGAERPGQILGKHMMDFIHPDYKDIVRRRFEAVRSGSRGVPLLEEKFLHLDGSSVDVEVAAISFVHKGEPGAQVIARDITARKQAEEARRQSELLFRTLFELSPDAILLIDPHDSEGSRPIVDCNAAACLMNGYQRDELIGHSMDILNESPTSPSGWMEYANQVRDAGIWKYETYHRHKNGKVFPIEVATSFIKIGERELLIGIDRDISERKQAEEKLAQQAEELRRRNEQLARLYRASASLISRIPLNPKELAQKIVETVLKEFGQSNCSLLLVNPDSKELERLAIAGPYAEQVKYRNLSLDGPGLVPRAVRTAGVVNVSDVRTAADYVEGWNLARSELAIPLSIGTTVIGAMDMQSSQPNAFSPDDERLMTVFAERAALALEHGRLNAQTEARMRQLVALRTIDMAISGSFDIRLTLGVLLDQVVEQLGVHAIDVLAFSPLTQSFNLVGQRGFRNSMVSQMRLDHGAGFVWQAIGERQAINIPDLRSVPDGLQRSPDLTTEQFRAYICIPLIAKGQIKGVLEVFHREPLKLDRDRYAFMEMLAGQAAIAMDNAEMFEGLQSSNTELRMAYDSTLEGWAKALELRDQDTEGHTRRVAELTIRLARELGVNEADMVNVYRGALLHDIGKMGVPDRIMLKPGPLTDEEWVIMRQHPQYAYDMLASIGYLHQALDIPYCHHEKWDGSGYPRGLKGEQIPFAARIFAIVDVWDALTSNRPYRKAWPKEKALEYIGEQIGKHFDPTVAKVFLREVTNA